LAESVKVELSSSPPARLKEPALEPGSFNLRKANGLGDRHVPNGHKLVWQRNEQINRTTLLPQFHTPPIINPLPSRRSRAEGWGGFFVQ